MPLILTDSIFPYLENKNYTRILAQEVGVILYFRFVLISGRNLKISVYKFSPAFAFKIISSSVDLEIWILNIHL